MYKKVLKVIFTLLSIGMMLCGIVGLAVFSSDKYSQYEKNLLTSPDFYVFFLPIGLVVFFIIYQHLFCGNGNFASIICIFLTVFFKLLSLNLCAFLLNKRSSQSTEE